MNKQELKDGKVFNFESDEDTLEVQQFTRENSDRPNWALGYSITFNLELTTFKTWGAAERLINRLIKDYNLELVEEEN